MDHMHRNGIFHRDIKPENILIMEEVLKVNALLYFPHWFRIDIMVIPMINNTGKVVIQHAGFLVPLEHLQQCSVCDPAKMFCQPPQSVQLCPAKTNFLSQTGLFWL
jgi:serine/threonine protein kinase